jgi:hypothetical protein
MINQDTIKNTVSKNYQNRFWSFDNKEYDIESVVGDSLYSCVELFYKVHNRVTKLKCKKIHRLTDTFKNQKDNCTMFECNLNDWMSRLSIETEKELYNDTPLYLSKHYYVVYSRKYNNVLDIIINTPQRQVVGYITKRVHNDVNSYRCKMIASEAINVNIFDISNSCCCLLCGKLMKRKSSNHTYTGKGCKLKSKMTNDEETMLATLIKPLIMTKKPDLQI